MKMLVIACLFYEQKKRQAGGDTLTPLSAVAQESTSANIIGVGSSRILDTYINQEKYSGIGFTYLYIKERARSERRWNSIIEHEIDLSSTKDRSKDNQMIEGNYYLYWGLYRHWQLFGDRFLLQAGGLANANLGFHCVLKWSQ